MTDQLEFFWTTDKTRLMVHDIVSDDYEAFTANKMCLAKKIDRKVKDCYPETYQRLCELYGDQDCFTFARANRFLKCNFSVHDNQPDIDDDWNFTFELVPCPLRGECKDCICKPKLTSELSAREQEIIRHHAGGFTHQEIGERLFISEHTVHNHLANIYRKLDLRGNPNPDKHLINYAYKNHLI